MPGPPCRPPPGRQEAAPGDQRAPPTPPPPPTQAQERTEADRRNGGPAPPPKEAAAPGVRGHHGRGRRLHALPAAGRRRTGGAQDGANGAALLEAGPGKTGARTRAGGFPPPPPPPPPHWPVGGRPDRARRPRPPGNPHGTSIPRGGTPDTTDGRPTPDGAGGRGGGPPTPPPRSPPPAREPQERPAAPPEPRGRPPPPGGTATRGGDMRLDLHTARPSAPSRLLPRGSRPQGEPTPACPSNARTKLGGGAQRRTRTVWRPRPT